MPLVFAYGSNLDLAQMRRRCPSAEIEGPAVLPGHALTFDGRSGRWGGAVANVVRSRRGRVQGLLYRVSPGDLHGLDGFEGAPFVYQRVARMVVDSRGLRRRAQVYVQAQASARSSFPARAYFDIIRNAYQRLGFDPKALFDAAAGGGL